MMNELREAYHLLKTIRDRCLIAEDDYIGVTQEPHIDIKLFDEICIFLNHHKDLFE